MLTAKRDLSPFQPTRQRYRDCTKLRSALASAALCYGSRQLENVSTIWLTRAAGVLWTSGLVEGAIAKHAAWGGGVTAGESAAIAQDQLARRKHLSKATTPIEVTFTRRRRQSADSARKAILEGAVDLVAEHGLEGLRVRDVATRAQINHSTLLHHLGDRDGLLLALAQRVVDELERITGEEATAGDARLARQMINGHLDDILTGLAERPADFALLSEVFVRASRDPRARDLATQAEERWVGFLTRLLKPLASDGANTASNPRRTALAITLLVRGYGLAIDRDPVALRRAVTALVDQLAKG
jgi:AcrR family transcriptional regulator